MVKKTRKATRRQANKAKGDALTERLSKTIEALRERRKGGAKTARLALKKAMAEKFTKRQAKLEKKVDKFKTERDEWRGKYRALAKSTKQLLKLAGLGLNVRNKTEGASSNEGGAAPATPA